MSIRYNIEDFFWGVFKVFLGALGVFLIFLIVNVALGYDEQVEVQVVGKAYTPSSSNVGVSASGNPVVTSQAEAWILLYVDPDTGSVEKLRVRSDQWVSTEPGETMEITRRRGKWLN